MSPKLRIHYAKWKCPHFAGFDNYTDMPGLVTCPFCKRELARADEQMRAPVHAAIELLVRIKEKVLTDENYDADEIVREIDAVLKTAAGG